MRKYLLLIILLFTFIIGYKLKITEKVFLNKVSPNLPKLYINYFDPKSLTYTFFQYDPISSKNKKLFKKNIEDYTSFVYSSDNKLYFADKSKNNNTKQLYVRDLNTHQIRQLTTELSYLDFIKIDQKHNILFMRVMLRNEHRNFHLATYNIKTNTLKIWNKSNSDNSILDFDYSQNKYLVVVSYSNEEATNKLEEANKNQTSMTPPKYSIDIFETEGKLKKHVGIVEKFINGVSLSPDNSSIIYSYNESLNSKITKVKEINVGTSREIIILKNNVNSNIRAVKYDNNKIGFYFLSSLNKSNNYNSLEIPKKSILSYYNFKTKKIKEVWSTEKGVIVNYSINN